MTGRSPHSSAVQYSSAVEQSDDAFGEETDGRRLRRALNREAVVDALLSLYDEGNLRPGTDRIAERAGISPRSLFRYFDDRLRRLVALYCEPADTENDRSSL